MSVFSQCRHHPGRAVHRDNLAEGHALFFRSERAWVDPDSPPSLSVVEMAASRRDSLLEEQVAGTISHALRVFDSIKESILVYGIAGARGPADLPSNTVDQKGDEKKQG